MSGLLINLFNVIRHSLQKSADRFLIALWNLAVLLNNSSLICRQVLNLLRTREYVNCIYTKHCDSREVRRVRVTSTPLVASLRIAIHTTRLGQILLTQR